jgi:hypothetical protein
MSEHERALEHLGNVLSFFIDIDPDYRCRAFEDALAYYNARCPTKQVVSEFPGSQRIITDPLGSEIKLHAKDTANV